MLPVGFELTISNEPGSTIFLQNYVSNSLKNIIYLQSFLNYIFVCNSWSSKRKDVILLALYSEISVFYKTPIF